jgi:CMP-N,N'-diacetyllegionaminic acid synthase
MELLGLIPARGGSKGIPHKNIVHLAGRPLLSYTCEAATQSRSLSRVILSTDSEEIASVGKEYGVEVPSLRPAPLAQDSSLIIDVLRSTLATLAREGYVPDAVMLLQPTSPLRTAKHIDEAAKLFSKPNTDTVVSVAEVPHHYTPYSLMQMKGEYVELMDANPIFHRQDKKPVYARNGPAVLILKREILEAGKLYGDFIRPYVMQAEESVDIDTPFDLTFAEFLLKRSA